MRITDITTTPVAVPTLCEDACGPASVTSVIVQIFTDEGLVGIGESPTPLGAGITTDIIQAAKPRLVGKDPSNVNTLIKQLYAEFNLARLHIHLAGWAFSGIELALWDIAARQAGLPLYQLWGGAFRDRMELIGVIERQAPSQMTAEAERLVGLGYHTLFTQLGQDPETDVAAVAAIRAGAPDKAVRICADANQAWTTGVAVNTIRRLEPYGIGWIEQPVMMYNLDGLKDVKDGVNVPILGHESNWTMYELLGVLKKNCVDYVKLDACYDAGYYGVRISAGMAEAGGTQCVYSDSPQLGIGLAGSLQVMASSPNFSMPRQLDAYRQLQDDVIIGGCLAPGEEPFVDVPQQPGIGVDIDLDKLSRYHEEYLAGAEHSFATERQELYRTETHLHTYLKNAPE